MPRAHYYITRHCLRCRCRLWHFRCRATPCWAFASCHFAADMIWAPACCTRRHAAMLLPWAPPLMPLTPWYFAACATPALMPRRCLASATPLRRHAMPCCAAATPFYYCWYYWWLIMPARRHYLWHYAIFSAAPPRRYFRAPSFSFASIFAILFFRQMISCRQLPRARFRHYDIISAITPFSRWLILFHAFHYFHFRCHAITIAIFIIADFIAIAIFAIDVFAAITLIYIYWCH